MMRSTKSTWMMRWLFAIFLAVTVNCLAFAQGVEGTWMFEKAIAYGAREAVSDVPPFSVISIRDNKATFLDSCSVNFNSVDYDFSEVFQGISKDGLFEASIESFIAERLEFSLSKTKEVFRLSTPARKCARPAIFFFYTGKRIVILVGEIFYSYTKTATVTPNSAAPSLVMVSKGRAAKEIFGNYKVTPLPMDFYKYFATCRAKILAGTRNPRTTDKCSPDYYPYVADPKSSDILMKLVGNHDYVKGGSESAYEFSPPFEEKKAAAFLVFAPMRKVILVRVDDFELVKSDERTVMTGVYLSIVDGKVVDQISGCDIDRKYVCRVDGGPLATLTDSGQFERN